jgi:trimeric autotransporter adhesin
MKKMYTVLIFFIYCMNIRAQNVGLGTATPNLSAELDISSTTKGLLIPRMTTLSVLAVPGPAKGLLVYDSVKNLLMVNMGTVTSPDWESIVAGSGWALNGNGGSDTVKKFIGTTDAEPLLFRIRNTWAGMIDSASGSSYLGFEAGQNGSAGVFNSGFGYQALQSNTTGNYNSAFGVQSLFLNPAGGSIGDDNTAVGYQALFANYGKVGNTAVGYQSLYNNSGNLNTAAGYQAMFLGGGGGSTAVGAQALYTGGGSSNTALGAKAMYNSSASANYNTAMGYSALYNNSTGSFNTASGYQAMYNNLSGQYNSAMGTNALYANTTGSQNTSIGAYSLFNSYASDGNTALGYYAGSTYDNGYYNVFIGPNTDVNGVGYYNTIALGYGTLVTAPNMMRVGNGATVSIGGVVDWSVISDGRVKKNIQENVPGLTFITRLRPVSYNIDLAAVDRITHPPIHTDNKGVATESLATELATAYKAREQTVHTGFIAQEVEVAARSINYNFSGVDAARNENDLYGLRYADFVVPLVKAVQELSAQNDQIRNDNDLLKKQNALVQRRLAAIKQKML